MHKEKHYSITQKYYRAVGNLWGKYVGYPNALESFKYAADHVTIIAMKAGIVDGGQTVLDCGCGFGQTMVDLQRYYPSNKYIGVTISPNQVEKRVHSGVGLGNFEDLSLPNESVDVVYFIESLNHAHSKKKALKEAHRVLRPGGKLFILDQCVANDWYANMLKDFRKKNCYRFHRDFYGASPVSPEYIVRKAISVGFECLGCNQDLVNHAEVVMPVLKSTLIVEYINTVYSDFIFQK